jgi:hypothetical protein
MQTLDDRVTSLESSRVTLPGGTTIATGTSGGFTTTGAGRFTFTNPLGSTAPLYVGISMRNTGGLPARSLMPAILSTSSGNIVVYFTTVTAGSALATAATLPCDGFFYVVIG